MDIWVPVLVAVVTGVFSLWGSVIAGKKQSKDLAAQLDKNQAVFEAVVSEKISGLQKQVEKHNSIVERTYKLEAESLRHGDELKRLGARISEMEAHE